MTINETTTMNANMTLKDSTGVDTVVAYLSTSLDGASTNFNISVNVTNKALMTATATNSAGETVAQQYSSFEAAVKTAAKNLGYTIFA